MINHWRRSILAGNTESRTAPSTISSSSREFFAQPSTDSRTGTFRPLSAALPVIVIRYPSAMNNDTEISIFSLRPLRRSSPLLFLFSFVRLFFVDFFFSLLFFCTPLSCRYGSSIRSVNRDTKSTHVSRGNRKRCRGEAGLLERNPRKYPVLNYRREA